jgi:hypothetical protein
VAAAVDVVDPGGAGDGHLVPGAFDLGDEIVVPEPELEVGVEGDVVEGLASHGKGEPGQPVVLEGARHVLDPVDPSIVIAGRYRPQRRVRAKGRGQRDEQSGTEPKIVVEDRDIADR